ncbi:MAG: Na/Pi cotransporter family protein [Sedimentisphaerales bacterium]|nr:Na/Pi cotransporter family protein [Sedimentisphaerales bacterium]
MDWELTFTIIFQVLGGLGIFLLGMKQMSEGMQEVAGDRLRRLIGYVTNNRFLACGVGTTVTSIIQSSSVTTVMVVGMINAGLMTLRQGIGVIFGANIGTTMTGWLLTLKIADYGLPMLGIAAFFYLFSKNDRIRFTAGAIMGLGMVFFGLQLMSKGLHPIRGMEGFKEWFSRFEPNSYFGVMKCVLVGAILTGIVQSSSATLGITMSLAVTGVITYPTAAALVLGENIGTTVTALLASIGTTRVARRAAYAHTFFNVLGVLWITSLFFLYIKFIPWIMHIDPAQTIYTDEGTSYPNVKIAIAATHSGFNIINTLLFLPFIAYMTRFLEWLVPDPKTPEKPHLKYLDIRILDTPAIGIQQSQKEVHRMGDSVAQMLRDLEQVLTADKRKKELESRIFQTEHDLDLVQKDIVEFLGGIMEGNISHDVVDRVRRQLRISDEYESISDYVMNILKLRLKLYDNERQISEQGKTELLDLHRHVAAYIDMINGSVVLGTGRILKEAQVQGTEITHLMKEYRSSHLNRVEAGEASPLKSLIFTDMLNAYRRIKDHGLNIAEVMAGEK